ncbi:5-formyltetrahydrofolate cyclo-ligase [Paenibacillus sp. S150]|uniref:5-formyltetrahydrofolate cyclo-ligase n=1 Tax=Paenibacillus sp. S150 TaxID=2749826 RepID=UPI001C5A42EB|nr:5-formyltetrahydrofolate cyclo-ligase [Paenibacillus sp. S150]MBW4081433.1 5-formyltetrahydrofolate cyclo-ligase [Paenibacillus sp. S150]
MTGDNVSLAGFKRELRAERTAVRDGLTAVQRDSMSAQVCGHAQRWLQREAAASLLAYVPFRSELDCRPLITAAWAHGREVLLPRVIAATGRMSLHAVGSWEELAPGAYGILEPLARRGDVQEPETLRLPDVVFVPGLAFDLQGGRLGYGRGYYDRLRASWEQEARFALKPPVWIGLAFSQQLVPEVPMDDHDGYMDMLITEEGLFQCRKENKPWS